uniref:Alsin-like PH-like domain-containing protein n=1 Tax=Petromyzon marinus TaxID=7757 RepID=S4R9T6_PETMA
MLSLPPASEDVEEQHGLAVVWEGPGPFMVPRLLKSLSGKPVVQAALGWSHTLLLTRDGAVYSFGQQPWQDQAYVFAQEPRREMGLAGVEVVYIAAGARHSGAVGSLGDVYMWGSNLHGQCAVRDTEEVPSASPRNCAGSRGRPHISLLACGHTHTLAWSQTSDEMWGWGNSSQLCHAAADPPAASASRIQYQPRRIEHFVGVKVRQLVCGALHNLALVEVLHENHAPGTAQPPAAQPVLSRNVTAGSDNFTASGEWMSLTEDTLEGISIRIEDRAKEYRKNSNRSDRGMRLKTFVSDDLSSSFEKKKVSPAVAPANSVFAFDSEPLDSSTEHFLSSDSVSEKQMSPVYEHIRRYRHRSTRRKETMGRQPEMPRSQSLKGSGINVLQVTPDNPAARPAIPAECAAASRTGAQAEECRNSASIDTNQLGHNRNTKEFKPEFDHGKFDNVGGSSTGRQSPSKKEHFIYRICYCGDLPTLLPGFAAGGGAARAGESPSSATSATVSWERGWQTASTQPRRQRLEVWSWGDGQDGQLGLGDTLSRLVPQCIPSLVGEEIIKLAAGDFHSLALTSTSKVYSWGRNRSGQLGHDKLRCLTPHLLETLPAGEVLDVAAAEEHSLFAINREDSYDSRVYYCSRLAGHGSGADEMQGPPIVHLPLPNQKLQVTQVQAGGEQSLVLALQTAPPPYLQLLHEFFKSERDYVQVLGSMKDVVFHPLLQEDNVKFGTAINLRQKRSHFCSPQPMTSSPLGRSTSATEHPFAGHVHIQSVHVVTEQTAIQDAYEEYFAALTNLLVIRGLESINSNSFCCLLSQQQLLSAARETLGSSQGVVETLYCILMAPASHMQNYSMFATCLLTCFPMESPQYEWAKAVSLKWDTFYNDVNNLIEQAYSTREFWLQKTSKGLENLCVPTRRVIKDSISLPLSPVKTSRFATHRYILFNDIFLHTKGATQTVYCVSTIWVETLNDNNQNVYGLRVYTPEEELHLASSTALNRVTWQHSIAYSISSFQTSSSGSSPQDSPGHRGRESLSLRTDCGYTFRKLPQLRGAHYYGQWCDGKPHGWGRMTWPDGRTYIGNFKFGSEHGYGKYTVANASTGKKEKYCGEWREGKINGYGLYKHADGEVYEGYLVGGVRHGHGMLLSSKGEHAGGVYVGHWASGKRAGYGVYENVSR